MREVRWITSSETVLGAFTLHILTQTLMRCWMGQSGTSAQNCWERLIWWSWLSDAAGDGGSLLFSPPSPAWVLSLAGTSTIQHYVPSPEEGYKATPYKIQATCSPNAMERLLAISNSSFKHLKYLKIFGHLSSISWYSSFILLLPSPNIINI